MKTTVFGKSVLCSRLYTSSNSATHTKYGGEVREAEKSCTLGLDSVIVQLTRVGRRVDSKLVS